jgi:hypothetical protein
MKELWTLEPIVLIVQCWATCTLLQHPLITASRQACVVEFTAANSESDMKTLGGNAKSFLEEALLIAARMMA